MNKFRTQAGATLIEIMIGLALSMIVTASMVGLMGNSMGSATRIIQMTQLSDELRNAMSMLARDVRRANYSAGALYCYANPNCGEGLTDVDIPNDKCVIYRVDRKQDNFTSTIEPGGFRHVVDAVTGIGSIEMWVGGDGVTCGDSPNWFPLTDSNFVDITDFSIVNSTILESIVDDDGSAVNQRINTINVEMEGALRIDDRITRRIEDTIKVRNDFIWNTEPPAP